MTEGEDPHGPSNYLSLECNDWLQMSWFRKFDLTFGYYN